MHPLVAQRVAQAAEVAVLTTSKMLDSMQASLAPMVSVVVVVLVVHVMVAEQMVLMDVLQVVAAAMALSISNTSQ
jgi:polyribonucleotide nucleotidyltransferase